MAIEMYVLAEYSREVAIRCKVVAIDRVDIFGMLLMGQQERGSIGFGGSASYLLCRLRSAVARARYA